MLRWNTPSAICAILITANPLTSFAQQIVTPAPPEISILQEISPLKMPGEIRKVAYQPMVPLVSPQEAVAQNPTLEPPSAGDDFRTAALSPLKPMPPIQLRKSPITPPKSFNARYRRPGTSARPVEQAASPKIIIRTPFVQPHNPNNYLFVVENVGQVDATTAAVDLFVPQGVVITGVAPANATSTAQRAHVRLTNLGAGAKSIIEVQVQPTTDIVEFQTRLSSESVHKFTTSANPDFVSRNLAKSTPTSAPTVGRPSSSATLPKEVAFVSPLTPLATGPSEATTKSTTAPSEITSAIPAAISSAIPTAIPSAIETADARTGKAQPPNIANAMANMAKSIPATLASSTTRAAATESTPASSPEATQVTLAPQPTAEANLSATVDGPVTLTANQEADFSISVTNPNRSEASNIVVQLAVPAGMKITVLDREAWFDEENQTISWELPTLKPGQQELIQYRAVGTTTGQQNQKITIGMQNVYQGKAQLVTLVSN